MFSYPTVAYRDPECCVFGSGQIQPDPDGFDPCSLTRLWLTGIQMDSIYVLLPDCCLHRDPECCVFGSGQIQPDPAGYNFVRSGFKGKMYVEPFGSGSETVLETIICFQYKSSGFYIIWKYSVPYLCCSHKINVQFQMVLYVRFMFYCN